MNEDPVLRAKITLYVALSTLKPAGFRDAALLLLSSVLLLSLIALSIPFEISVTLADILNFIDGLIVNFFDFLKPLLDQILNTLERTWNIELNPGSNWRYYFILFGIYYTKEASINYKKFWKTSLWTLILGTSIGFIFSVLVSIIDDKGNGFLHDLLVPYLMIFGAILYHQIGSIFDAVFNRNNKKFTYRENNIGFFEYYAGAFKSGIYRMTCGILLSTLLAILFLIPYFDNTLIDSRILTILLLYFLFGLYWTLRAASSAINNSSTFDEFKIAFNENRLQELGRHMMAPILYGSIVIYCNGILPN